MAEALHEIAVRGQHVGVVVEQLGPEAGAQEPLGDGHADRVAEALAQRAGGDLDAGGVAGLGMAGGGGTPLAEVLQIVELEPVPGQVQVRVEQHRGVPAGEDQTIAVGPFGIGGVVAHHPREQHVGRRGQRHGGALVPGPRLVGHVHGQAAHSGDGALLDVAHEVMLRSLKRATDAVKP